MASAATSSFGFAQGALAAEAVLGVRDRMVATGESLVSRAANTIREAGPDTRTRVAVGDAAETILDCAERWGAELIVVGTHGRRGNDRLVLGSVVEAVVRQAGRPVETVSTPVP
jgi:nucleotide-binding universal stress UspA family protein